MSIGRDEVHEAGPSDDPREELASIAASLRAYLELQQETGASGIPRRPRALSVERRPADAPEPARTAERSVERAAAPEPVAGQVDDPPKAAVAGQVDDPPKAAVAGQVDDPPKAAVAGQVDDPPKATSEAPRVLRPLAVVAEEVRGCQKCGLAATRTNTVFARGNPEARLCFVGEGPGADEDAQGLPFVGRAGQLLDKMIQAMGLDPADGVYICNIVKCRPPGNRRPEPPEIDACMPYLHEQLAVIEPKVIVALGNTAVAALVGTRLGITKVRGAWKLYRGRIPVMPTYHPSYLLRPSAQQAEAKRQAWDDLQKVMKELGLPTARRP
jgi:uracil-DNA glycosylase